MIDLALSNPAFRPHHGNGADRQAGSHPTGGIRREDKPGLVKKLKDLVALMGDLGLPGSVVEELELDAPQKNLWEVRKAGLTS